MGLWNEQDLYIDQLENNLRDNETKSKGQDSASRREHLLVVRLATKDQEMQELSNQIAELKSAQIPSTNALRNTLIDPAVNLVIIKLKKELEATKTKMQETQEELSAWKFTPDSVTGKRLMSKCRQLLQENEDIGKMISSGRLAKLEGELAMQKNLCEEMKKNQAEMDDFVQELDEDVEGMQSTIYFLQQQLKEAKETIANLQQQQQQEQKLQQPSVETAEEGVEKEHSEPEVEKETEMDDDKMDESDNKNLDRSFTPESEPLSTTEPVQAAAEDDEEKEGQQAEEEDQALSLRLSRRGRATPTKSTTESPSKRGGRSTRGQKREVDDDDSVPVSGSGSGGRGRPKRRRAAPQRFNKDRTKSESENLPDENSDEN